MQIFCFTYAGGNTSFFKIFEKKLNNNFKLISFDYAGHGLRFKENFYKDFNELAENLYNKLKNNITGDYCLLGYSMGSLALVSILELIIKKHEISLPKKAFMFAHEPMKKRELLDYRENEIDDFIKKHILTFGGIPEKLINNDLFWRTYLPIYKADFSILNKFDFQWNFQTDVECNIFYSETDSPLKKMKKWKDIFIGEINFYKFNGNHFFIYDNIEKICKIINNDK